MDYPLSKAVQYDLVGGKFTDGVPGVTAPSVIPSQTTNDIIDEILNVQALGGVAKSEAVKTQLATAIQNMIEARVGDYALDTGILNAFVVAMNPAIAVYTVPIEGSFRAKFGNTQPCTLNAGGGVLPLKRNDGSALEADDIPLNSIVSWALDPVANVFLVKGVVPSQEHGRLIGVQVFTANGTYTPTPGTKSVVVEVQGGGGGGGGSPATGAGQMSSSSGGNGGTYGRSRITAGFAGVAVTIGAGGTGGVGVTGSPGGTSSFGAFVSAPGGTGGGPIGPVIPPAVAAQVGNVTPASGGNISNEVGGIGAIGILASTGSGFSGSGGSSKFGGGPQGSPNGAGANGVSKGTGGSGALTTVSSAANTGGNGAPGIVIVWEYA